ncbi:Inherit from KOG: Set and mynd domain containing [Seminavis robusta]|uniref:Inherit from KOG: Set and mynd domain containing n=1 Tax=Seminavis robusta TaxID=568900 RepID=A0A9N8DUW4_9STRA|nr:Inherit from KOG: Set and mynd domain containing [Seminavis robusta]|eukprot:Sro369_g128190.1 Inherit from KOG: Set and mynd domain containing (453) ;mRNA; f:38150-39508
MMDAYLNSDAASRKDMMDMYCPPLPEEETEAEQKTNGDIDAVLQRKQEETLERLDWLEFDWNQYACQEPSIKTSMPLETARRVMRIIDANAHNYAIQTTGGIVDTPQNDQSALFALGSKVEHSCAPNLNYATEHGKLQYTAIRPIANGERISISYDTPKFSHPRKQRREFLQMSKEFTCRCRRCRGPDECSPYQFSCPTCSSSSIAFSNESGDEYFCISCQFTLPSSNSGIREQKELENSLSQQLETEQSNMQAGVFDKKMISRMVALLNTMTQQLHPLHWLLPQGCDLMSSMATSVARLDMKGGQSPTSPMVRTLLYLSTLSWLNQACWWQRMGAVAYQDMELKDAVRDSKTPAPLLLTENPTLHTVETMAEQVCENLSTNSFVNMAHPIYHAGQDWLLAGHAPQVARLYQAFMPIFQQWNKLGDETRDNIAVLVQTEGATNEFPNHLLLS